MTIRQAKAECFMFTLEPCRFRIEALQAG